MKNLELNTPDAFDRYLANKAIREEEQGKLERKAEGGSKFDGDKLRMDLIPAEAIYAIARVLTYGAKKYGDRNWEEGLSWSRPYAALLRHAIAWFHGEETDPESGLSHLDHVAANAAFLSHYTAKAVGTDDRPYGSEEGTGDV